MLNDYFSKIIMDWKEISAKLDKELEESAAFPTDEHEQLVAKVWYWKGIANYAHLMAIGEIEI